MAALFVIFCLWYGRSGISGGRIPLISPFPILGGHHGLVGLHHQVHWHACVRHSRMQRVWLMTHWWFNLAGRWCTAGRALDWEHCIVWPRVRSCRKTLIKDKKAEMIIILFPTNSVIYRRHCGCHFDYTAVAGSGKVGPVNQVNHTSWVAIVTPTDRPMSVRNSSVIELFEALFVLSFCPFDISVGVWAFVIGLSQISSFFSYNTVCVEITRLRKIK